MCYSHYGGQYEPESMNWSKGDRKAMLEEKKAVLEAKLATVNHWIESLDEEESESEEK